MQHYVLKLRNLYNDEIKSVSVKEPFGVGTCVQYNHNYYVICDRKEMSGYISPCNYANVERAKGIRNPLYVVYVTYEPNGKEYAYWTDKFYSKGDKVLIQSLYIGEIYVTVTKVITWAGNFANVKARKILPVIADKSIEDKNTPSWSENALTKVQTNVETLSESFEKLTESIYNIKPVIYGNRRSEIHYCNEEEYNNIMNDEKENKTMNFMKNLEFGKINTTLIKMSMCGLAFQRTDKSYATYDAKSNTFTDVTDFLMDMDCVFVMPVAAKDIKEGDVIKHLNTYVVVKSVNEDNTISAISPIKAEEICIIPTKNLFGFNYYSKVMNFFDGMMTPDAENPFGNPLMLMMLFGDNKDFGGDMKSMLPLLLLNNQNGDMKDIMSNPLFFLAMSK